MLFNTKILRTMLDEIASDKLLGYDIFWKNILIASDLNYKDLIKNDERYFSEFESYGTYIDYRFPKMYVKRKLRTLRPGADFLGSNPSKEIIDWAGKDFDTISFEAWSNPDEKSILLVNDEKYRKNNSFASLLKKTQKKRMHDYYKSLLKRNQEEIINCSKLIGVLHFDFFFGNSISYRRFQNPLYVIMRFVYSLIFLRKNNGN